MIQTSDTQNFATARNAARLGPNHGYRIDGDIASLHAEIALELETSAQAQWALQLWACDTPFDGGALSGVKIAEAALPLPERALEPQRLDAQAYASLPGGQRDYSMVLVLASGEPGAFDQIHDFANYPARQRFFAPHLDGSASFQIDGDQVVLRAERVRNPRSADNLSGSLALELWALPNEYHGGTFSGEWLAGVAIGRIPGDSSSDPIEQRMAFTAPKAGEWRVVLMLREWGQDGYVTRDYCTFEEPYVVAAAKPASPPINGTPAPKPTAVVDGRISITHGSVEALAQVKGLTKKIAQEIVKARPFSSLDELVKVRGIGPKLLAKLRSQITL